SGDRVTDTCAAVPTKVNSSLADVADVPNGVVTVMCTVPASSAGDTAVITWSGVFTSLVKDAASVDPNFTDVAPVKPVPVIVTVVPPAVGPAVGLTEVTVGASRYKNSSETDVADVPPTVVTRTCTGPAACGGAVAVICPSLSTVKDADVEPKLTSVAPVNPEPEIVTIVPPALGPAVGFT